MAYERPGSRAVWRSGFCVLKGVFFRQTRPTYGRRAALFGRYNTITQLASTTRGWLAVMRALWHVAWALIDRQECLSYFACGWLDVRTSKIDCSTIVNPQESDRAGHARLTIDEHSIADF
ncbi:hypothetical protein [Prosthecobacter sp.]|uniref:hypothetical protein n=1 Tax=Prosthecobacter sp. TaxID=1965333 RepID=UPI003BAF5C9C